MLVIIAMAVVVFLARLVYLMTPRQQKPWSPPISARRRREVAKTWRDWEKAGPDRCRGLGHS